MSARVLSVNVASPASVHTGAWTGRMGRTGIDKRPVAGAVPVTRDGVGADVVVDREHHGAPHRAVYAYADEDARVWAQLLGRPVVPGELGENLTTGGLDVRGAMIGERWAVGTAVVEVSGPRIPCRVFAGWWGVPDLVRRFAAEGRPGAYLRVVTAGEVRAGDAVDVVHRPAHGLTVVEASAALVGGRVELLPRLAEVAELAPDLQERARRRLPAAG